MPILQDSTFREFIKSKYSVGTVSMADYDQLAEELGELEAETE